MTETLILTMLAALLLWVVWSERKL